MLHTNWCNDEVSGLEAVKLSQSPAIQYTGGIQNVFLPSHPISNTHGGPWRSYFSSLFLLCLFLFDLHISLFIVVGKISSNLISLWEHSMFWCQFTQGRKSFRYITSCIDVTRSNGLFITCIKPAFT